MASTLIGFSRRHPFLAVVFAVCAGIAIWGAVWGAYTWMAWNRLLADARAIDAGPASGSAIPATWSFAFQDATCTVTARVDPADLARARAVDTSRAFGAPVRLRADYLPRFVRDQAESRFIGDLAKEFRRIRSDLALDDDEYLELLASSVQAIPYGEPKSDILLPIEVVADGEGVCSEKSILLAALLVREGYATAVFALPAQRHVGVGVKSDAARFAGSDYAFVETTRPALVGDVSAENRARGPMRRLPVVMVVSDGIAYTSGGQVEYIVSRVHRSLTPIEFNRGTYPAFKTPGAYWALQAEQARATSRLAQYVLDNPHDRERVYRALVINDALSIGY